MVDHPLFQQSRRPWIKPETVHPHSAAHFVQPTLFPPPVVKLVGVVWNRQHRTALIASQTGTGTHVVHEGDRVDGWNVQAIERGGVVFQQADQRVTIRFTHALQRAR